MKNLEEVYLEILKKDKSQSFIIGFILSIIVIILPFEGKSFFEVKIFLVIVIFISSFLSAIFFPKLSSSKKSALEFAYLKMVLFIREQYMKGVYDKNRENEEIRLLKEEYEKLKNLFFNKSKDS